MGQEEGPEKEGQCVKKLLFGLLQNRDYSGLLPAKSVVSSSRSLRRRKVAKIAS